jgi:hypothetical protein
MTTQEMFVVVRDHDECQFVEKMDDWDATTLLGSVSSDPRTIRELGLSWLRYRQNQPLGEFKWQTWTEASPLPNRDWLLIDLANLHLAANDAEVIPDAPAAFRRSEAAEDPVVWINIPPVWSRGNSTDASPILPPAVARQEPLDFRGVLFGRAMAIDFATRMQLIAACDSLPSHHCCWDELPRGLERDDPRRDAANRWHELTMQVHAAWLTNRRDDLNQESPRDFLHKSRGWVEREIDNRSQQWSRLRTPPRPLDRETFSCVHGPMGRDEVVVYYDLCREILRAGWSMLGSSRGIQNDRDLWARQMYDHGRTWLREGQIDDCPTPPADIIASSRRHMPQLADGTHLDCECPVCRMISDDHEMFYPTFAFFDGHHLETEGEFAFSLCETREEWEEQEAAYGG